jgi:lipid-A-disaccharide synthase
VVPELMQEVCTPERLAASVEELLGSERVREAQYAGFREVVEILGAPIPPPSERAAKVVLDIVAGVTPQAIGTATSAKI